jgi:glutamate/tyrosine decarboxylase-like PLP-dependent enzyme
LFEDAARRVARRLARAGERALVPSGAALPAECWTAGALVPDHPVPDADLLARLELLLDGAMNPAHPGYVGHMDPPATTMSLVGDLAAAAVNNNLLSVEMSPAFSRLEWRLCAALAECFGLGDGAGGVMTAGGSLANLLALAVARNQAFAGAAIMAEGLAGLPRQPVLFASELAHTSVRKSAMLLGLGTDAVVPVGVDERGCLDAAALERAVAGAERHGQAPFAVVATAGTTVTGSIDPLDAIADVAARNGLWLHVDAAYGGGLVFSDAERGRLDGIGRADSLTFNPQKWAYVAKTCAMALFRDVAVLERHLRIAAPYMRELEDDPDAIPNLGELGVQGTRHADVLKLWLTLQQLGRDGLAALVAHGYALARAVVERVHARAYLTLAPECAPEPAMNVVCFRGTPAWLPPARWDAWNAELQAALVAGGHAFLSLPRHRGARWLRVVLLNPATTVATLDALFAAVDAFAVTTRAAAQTP